MSPPTAADTTTKSGITTSSSGERHIPSSTRADGTTRKEIKVRPGYKPPEDVEVYKNRTAAAWKTRGAGGVPGATAAADNDEDQGGGASNKNAKRREARRRAKGADDADADGDAKGASGLATGGKGEDGGSGSVEASSSGKGGSWRASSKEGGYVEAEVMDPEAEMEKQARTLRKKLRQASELREKREKGVSLLPEQFEKVIRINELMRQLDALGLSPEGEGRGKG